MSSAAILFFSSSTALQSKCALLASLRVKDLGSVTTSGNGRYRCSSCRPGVARVIKEYVGWEETNHSRLIAAKAGLGRYSGAIHGNSQRKTRRRKQSVQQEEDEHEGLAGETEKCHSQTQEPNDDKSSGDGSATDEIPADCSDQASYERYLEEIGDLTWVHDDGVSSSRPRDDGGLDESRELSSHDRYLQEIGVSPQNREDGGESPSSGSENSGPDPDPSEFRDTRRGEKVYQTHACSRISDGSSWLAVGAEGDLGYEQFAQASSTPVIVASDPQVSSYHDSGVSNGSAWSVRAGKVREEGDLSYEGRKKETAKNARDKRSARGRRLKKMGESEAFSVDEIAPMAATVLTNPELFEETFSSEIRKPSSSDREGTILVDGGEALSADGKETLLIDGDKALLIDGDKNLSGDGSETLSVASSEVLSDDKIETLSVDSGEILSVERSVTLLDDSTKTPSVGSSVQGPEHTITTEGRRDQFPQVERRSGLEDGKEPPGAFDSGRRALKGKKQTKRLKKKFGTASSVLLEETGDNNMLVRVVADGAERPAISVESTEPRQSESRSEKLVEVNVLVTPPTAETLTESRVTRTAEGETDKWTGIVENLESFSVFEGYRGGSKVEGSGDLGEDVVLNESGSKFPSNGKSENGQAHVDVHGSSWIVAEKAGAAVLFVAPGGTDEQEELLLSRVASVVVDQAAQVSSHVETVVEQAVQVASKVVPAAVVEQAVQVASKVAEIPVVVVEQATQVGNQVVEKVVNVLPVVVTEQVVQVVDQVVELQTQAVEHASSISEHMAHLGQRIVDQVSETSDSVVDHVNDAAEQMINVGQRMASHVTETSDSVVEQVSDVAEQVANTVNEQVQQVTGSVATTASQVAEQVTDFFTDDDDESDSDDEFEAYKTSDLPEFRGKQGLDNFVVVQEGQGILSRIYDFYTYMLKQPLPEFAAAMFSAPILVSAMFTLLYLPQFEGLAFDETARDFFAAAGGDASTLHLSWKTVFQVFMFSLSLSTGLQPELAPLSPYTLVIANINALVAQLVFVFLSGAVFARLSQPSQPVRCSMVALVSTSPAQRKRKENAIKVLMARYVLAGPQPCELVDVKVDFTYKYNTVTRTGSYFRATQSLKLVRPEIAFLTHGMLVRHVIDDTSPLYQRTPEMLRKEDAVFCLSVVGLERSSMQSVFHVQHYCMVDNHVIWDAEFEDIILINKKNMRIVDHSRLSMWRPFRQ